MRALADDKLPDRFHVAWDNCDVNAAKVFRMLVTRPYFYPAFAETSPYNQIIVARGEYEDEEFKIPQQIDSASLVFTLRGMMISDNLYSASTIFT